MNTQTKVKEEIISDFDNMFIDWNSPTYWSELGKVGNVKEFLSQSLDRLEKSVREETIKEIKKSFMRSWIPTDAFLFKKFITTTLDKLTSQKEEDSHPQGEAYCETCLQQKGWQKEEEQKVPCKFSACHEFVSLHDTYCKKHMYLRIKEDK